MAGSPTKLDHLGTNLFLYGYDANDRLTNRTSAAKGATVYGSDPAGNLTNMHYAVSPDPELRVRTAPGLVPGQRLRLDPNLRLRPRQTAHQRHLRRGELPLFLHKHQHRPVTRLVRKLVLPSGAYITNAFDSVGRELFTKLYTSTNDCAICHESR
jgi:hypothetical protein